jgi:polyisoprenoid-binding protein YceI
MKTKTKNFKISRVAILLFVMFTSGLGYGQAPYRQNQVSITIAGTSTMHDWTMTTKDGVLQANLTLNADGTLSQINSLQLNVPAESLKSGKGAMDKNAYNSLKTDKFKQITFALTSTQVTGNEVKCTGNLTISGVTKVVQLDASCKLQPDNTFNCKGSKALKMTEYKVEPPTFMFGSIKTGDDITISFETTLSPVKL